MVTVPRPRDGRWPGAQWSAAGGCLGVCFLLSDLLLTEGSGRETGGKEHHGQRRSAGSVQEQRWCGCFLWVGVFFGCEAVFPFSLSPGLAPLRLTSAGRAVFGSTHDSRLGRAGLAGWVAPRLPGPQHQTSTTFKRSSRQHAGGGRRRSGHGSRRTGTGVGGAGEDRGPSKVRFVLGRYVWNSGVVLRGCMHSRRARRVSRRPSAHGKARQTCAGTECRAERGESRRWCLGCGGCG